MTDLLIPPPAKQCPVHDPCFCADVGHSGKKALHQGSEVWEAFFFADLFVGESETCDQLNLSKDEGTVQTGRHNGDESFETLVSKPN